MDSGTAHYHEGFSGVALWVPPGLELSGPGCGGRSTDRIVCTTGPHYVRPRFLPARSRIGRTSTHPTCAGGICEAIWVASLRSSASIR